MSLSSIKSQYYTLAILNLLATAVHYFCFYIRTNFLITFLACHRY